MSTSPSLKPPPPPHVEGRPEIYVHTISGKAFHTEEGVRLPSSYFRFEGLFEKAFKEGEQPLKARAS